MPIAVTLAAAIYFAEKTTGGHFNPAVTAAKAWMEEIERNRAVVYVAAQLVGAFLASQLAGEVA